MTGYPGGGGYGGPNTGAPQPQSPWDQPVSWDEAKNWNQQPAPVSPDAPTQWGAYQPTYYGDGMPQRNRKTLYIALGSGLAVVLVLAIVGSVLLFSASSSKSTSAGEMVQAYLEALARGDAEAALSYSADEPASTELLTDEILQQQIDELPISDIRILGDDSQNAAGIGTVHVTVKFGDQTSDATLSVKKVDGEWKLDSAAVRIDNTNGAVSSGGAASTLTAFGTPVGDSVFYGFQRYIEWGTDNENLEVTAGDPLLLDAMGFGGYASLMSLKYDVSQTGEDAIRAQLGEVLDRCARSKSMRPEGCPQYLIQYDAVEGTVTWRAPSPDEANITFYDYDMTARFDLQADWGYSVRVTDGGTETGTSTTFMYGDVDLTQDPLEITLK